MTPAQARAFETSDTAKELERAIEDAVRSFAHEHGPLIRAIGSDAPESFIVHCGFFGHALQGLLTEVGIDAARDIFEGILERVTKFPANRAADETLS